MIIFDLACPHDHRFEGWFQSREDFDGQLARGLTACPQCGSRAIRRVPSAVHLARPAPLPPTALPPAQPEESLAGDKRAGARAAYRQLTELAEVLLANCEDVGTHFAEEARRIHYLEARRRSIRGQASAEEYESLCEEGIEVLRLPRLKRGDLH
ncbi:conserved hypothetical protein [Candidatus Accumulibacter aalborgensis]|uniref:Uncharacterized protein n=1 Tax=Candidatus Accumulibacter aalborgensis TaxID=1860102 RepID=A0A1A8XJV8_9PROT|nr:DUF1178 family protein [Candidatus Accumulibacter aalborgensis]SBT04971.1 conserved hypothetical protein [Candidatus Accumulibacter aalborgensis]